MFAPVTGGGLTLGPTVNVTSGAKLIGAQNCLPSSKLGFRKNAIRSPRCSPTLTAFAALLHRIPTRQQTDMKARWRTRGDRVEGWRGSSRPPWRSLKHPDGHAHEIRRVTARGMTTSPTPAWGSRFTSEIPDSILGPALPPEARRGVVVPEATFLDVAAHDGGRAPAAVAHDGQLWGSRGIALSCEAGAQGMTRETSVESGGQRTTADHLGHGAIAEAGSCDPAVLGGPPYLARDSRRGRWGSPGGGAGPREVDAGYLRVHGRSIRVISLAGRSLSCWLGR